MELTREAEPPEPPALHPLLVMQDCHGKAVVTVPTVAMLNGGVSKWLTRSVQIL